MDYLNDDKVKLTDLLTVEELQQAQDVVSKMARVAVLITDENGQALTEGSNFTNFCMGFCRQSEEGKKRCEACDMMGAISSLKHKKPVFYRCHADLIDFAAPIMVNGTMIGSFIGGQILSAEPDLDKMRDIADEIGVDEEKFVQAALEVPILPESAIKRCTEFIYDYAQILSSMAMKAYAIQKEGEEALRAAAAKTDFLANMSHEIRTPMNAIIGMSQIALREEMSAKARDYLNQVSNSAEMLLTIINDILDYSKLDAGKMSIIEANYSPALLVKDVSSIIFNRIGGKEIEYLVDIDTSMPSELIGDDIRLKQILVNLANNAVKFTTEGQIKLSIKSKNIDDETIMLQCEITDTGIGIKKEDMERLFNSFEQVDSKRNRKIEGTGLGLAIVKELVETMGGTISVKSEYGVGSSFSFNVPQKVANSTRLVKLIDECPSVIGILGNPYSRKQLKKDMESLGAQYIDSDINEAVGIFDSLHVDYGIIEDELTTDVFRDVTKNHTHTIFFVICGDKPKDYSDLPNVKLLRRPVNILNFASAIMDIKFDQDGDEALESEFDFVAPDARVLIVDDNEVNLAVAEGLLEPLKMHIDTAGSGYKALEMISEKKYDIVFMDHMMPDMDGVETTKEIRNRFPELYNMPIIALTANALASSREELLMSGMNDFVAKPIVLQAICGVIKKWLPNEMIVSSTSEMLLESKKSDSETGGMIEKLTFLNTKGALELLKTEKLYLKVLKDYFQMIDKKYDKIRQCFESGDIKLFTVEVHALKSSSKQIGADSLSEEAKALEAAGNASDMDTINAMTAPMLEHYLELRQQLEPFFGDDEKEATGSDEILDNNSVSKSLDLITEALDELDFDKAEEIAGEFSQGKLEASEAEFASNIKEALMEMDVDKCTEIIDKWKTLLS